MNADTNLTEENEGNEDPETQIEKPKQWTKSGPSLPLLASVASGFSSSAFIGAY
jgi:hypothetical protein